MLAILPSQRSRRATRLSGEPGRRLPRFHLNPQLPWLFMRTARGEDVHRVQNLRDPRLKDVERSIGMNEKRAGDEPVTLDTRRHLESYVTRRDVLLGSAAGIMGATVRGAP